MSSRVVEDEEFSCPSFSSYSENKLAEIANKVASEANPQQNDAVPVEGEDYGDDDDFEFSLHLPEDTVWEVGVSSDDFNGRIFPVFNRDLLPHGHDDDDSRIAVPLSILLKKEKYNNNNDIIDHHNNNNHSNVDSCSSSEADELENIPSETYCVWRPNKCNKSRSASAGSASSRWAALRGLMKRSNSEGMKDNLVFLTPKKKKYNKEDRKAKEITTTTTTKASSSSAHEEFYVRNRAVKEGDKKKSYLPYRKELVGFFVNGNGFLPHV